MDMNIEQELKQFLEGMRSLGALKNFIEEARCGNKNCCQEEQQEDDEDDEECEILESLEQDYKDFMEWAFGSARAIQTSKRKSVKIWKKLHPGLPVPRVMQTEKGLNPNMSTICLFMDAYPLYLAEKNKCNG